MSRILVSLLLVATAFTAQAQDATPTADTSSSFGVTHSIYGGFNMSKVKVKGVADDDIEYGGGGDVGYSVLIPLGDSFAMRTGAGVTQKSAVVDTGILFNGEVTTSLTYIDVPITAYIPFGSGVVSGIGGVNVNILIAEDCEQDFGSCTTNSDDYKDIVSTAVIGARFRLGPATSHHNLEGLFETGLTDIDKNDAKLELGHSVRYVYNF